MRLEQGGAARVMEAAWVGASSFVQSWRRPWEAIAAAVARLRRTGRGTPSVPPMSDEWLHQHEVDAAKHLDSP